MEFVKPYFSRERTSTQIYCAASKSWAKRFTRHRQNCLLVVCWEIFVSIF